MKNIIYILIILFSIQANHVFSQWDCGTPDTSANMIYNEELSYMSIFQPRSFDDVTLRVYFHVIRQSNGLGGYSDQEVQQAFNVLQEDFNKHGITFAWDCRINYIDDDFYVLSPGSNSNYRDRLFNEVNNPDGIDIFLVRYNSDGGGFANGVGNESQLAVIGTYSGTPMGLISVISHEMGHVLFLWHTHHGCETGNWEFSDNHPEDTVNCEVAGDFLCDTPADPNMNFNVDPVTCEWTGEAHSTCEMNAPEPISNYNPDATNIMAYTALSCLNSFTDEQVQRMHNAIETLPFLQQCVVDEPFVYDHYGCIQAPEFNPIVLNYCLELIDNLKDYHLNFIPTGFQLVFGDEIDPESPTFSVVDPMITESGTYYGFYYNASTDIYGPPSEPIIINACCEFDSDIILTDSIAYTKCPEPFINLNDYYTGTPPEGSILIWSTSSDPESDPFPIVDTILMHNHDTIYYAYYYHEVADCYSEPSAGIQVSIESGINDPNPLYISGVENFDTPMYVGGNIIVEDQAILTITSLLEMGAEKGIFVEAGGKLIIEGPRAVLTVCDPLTEHWKGITLEPGSELHTSGGKILNVENGVKATGFPENLTTVILVDSEIMGKSLPGTNGVSATGVVGVGMVGTRVQGFTTGLRLSHGTYLSRILNSEFSNLDHAGISATHSNFVISDCQFYESLVGITGGHNSFVVSESIFKDVSLGIGDFRSNSITIADNEMYLSSIPLSTGIELRGTTEPVIRDNKWIEADHFGISLIGSPQASILNNTISMENDFTPHSGGAISLATSSKSKIRGNDIQSVKSDFGIVSNNNHGIEISANYLETEDQAGGIDILGSMRVIANSNSLVDRFGSGFGIRLFNSPFNQLGCNLVEDYDFGLPIFQNSESQIIRGNVLNNSVDLITAAEIGIQPFHGNLFKGGVARAVGLDFDQIQNSQFFVNSEYPYHMPTDPDPGNDEWFIDINNPDFYACPSGPEDIHEEMTPFSHDSMDLCQYYQNLEILEENQPNKFFLGVFDLWFLSESRQDFSLPACILSDQAFQNLCGMQELAAVVLDLEQYGQHELATDSLRSYQQQWVEANDSLIQAHTEELIEIELAALTDEFENARIMDSVLLSEIETDLSSIFCESELVNIWTGIYQQYISFLQAGEVDSADYNDLRDYSSLCSDIYGKPVHLARAVTATFDTTNFNQFDGCLQEMGERILQEQTVENAIKVWPNPTRGQVQLELPEEYSGELTVTDLLGRTLKSHNIEKADIELVELPVINGVYILNFLSEDGIMEQHKVMVAK